MARRISTRVTPMPSGTLRRTRRVRESISAPRARSRRCRRCRRVPVLAGQSTARPDPVPPVVRHRLCPPVVSRRLAPVLARTGASVQTRALLGLLLLAIGALPSTEGSHGVGDHTHAVGEGVAFGHPPLRVPGRIYEAGRRADETTTIVARVRSPATSPTVAAPDSSPLSSLLVSTASIVVAVVARLARVVVVETSAAVVSEELTSVVVVPVDFRRRRSGRGPSWLLTSFPAPPEA